MGALLADWLPGQRWYAGRNRQLSGVRTVATTGLAADLELVLFDVGYLDGADERYQLLVLWTEDARADYPAGGVIGVADGRHAYDALFDPEAAGRLLQLCADSARRDEVVFTAEPGAELPVGQPGRLLSAEQSNTSVVFGRQAIMKMFRRINPGINPDIELNRVLGRSGNPYVARLLASYDTTWDAQPCPLGMVTEFAAGADEGWALATAAAADGAQFVTPSRQLGTAVASVHAALAAELGSSPAAFPVDTVLARTTTAVAQVPALQQHAAAIEGRIRSVAGQTITVQRVHGDLHLGQVLLSGDRWLVIDFEGEPGAPLEERRRPDSALRDVAGMLRSFEYAAFQNGVSDAAADWAQRHRDAFCDGYADAAGADPRADAEVLAAYELDKAVYEAAYEARYRPDWLPIPLRSIERLIS